MIVTTVSAFLIAVIGGLFCLGVALGACLGVFMVWAWKATLPKPMMPPNPYALPPAVVQRQKDVIQKMKSLNDGKLSTRQQEILNEEVEKAILGKVGERP